MQEVTRMIRFLKFVNNSINCQINLFLWANELMQYFRNTSIATAVKLLKKIVLPFKQQSSPTDK